MDELSALDMIYDTSVPDLWDDLKFADTDEDWSVSESSSDSGNFNLDPLDVDSCNDLLPEAKVQVALCNLDLLASNTTSALSLPPFADADMDGLEGPEPSAARDGKALWSGAAAKDDQPHFASLSSRGAVHAPHLLQYQHQPQTLNNAQTQPAMPLSHDVTAVHPAPALAAVFEDDERPAPVPATPTFRAASLCTAGSQSPGTGLHKKRKIAGITPTPSVVKLPAGPAAAAHEVAKLASRNTRIKLEAAHATATAAVCGLAHRVHSAAVREASTGSACAAAKRTVTAKAGNRCEFCLEKFDTTDALQKHRQKHILGNSHFTCTFSDCKKHYATGEGLRLHVRNVHLMAKNWKCLADGCSRSFVRQSDLRMHIIRMHSDIRPFPCPVQACEKSFACHSELRRHVHSCHKLPCPKPEKVQSKTNFVDPSFIQALMLKTE